MAKKENIYYDGTKLLSLKDINGNDPEIYICTTNRSGGKTTWFNRYVFKRWINGRGKFMLIYRYDYELDNVAEKFFKDIKGLFFPEYDIQGKKQARGVFYELFAGKLGMELKDYNSCGYAVALNKADTLKKYSHFFSDTNIMIFDEFQSETNHYAPNEVQKLISIHTSVARGQGKQIRYVPVIMISNPVSIINPYFVELGISDRLKDNTKFMRGDGYVLEQGYIKAASEAQLTSAFNRAFASNSYIKYAAQCVYLNDSTAFIEKPTGKSNYLCTIRYNGGEYGLREYYESGYVYCDDKPDTGYPDKIAVTTDDHNINYVMLKRNEFFISSMRYYFERGCFRFKNQLCKAAVLKMLSY